MEELYVDTRGAAKRIKLSVSYLEKLRASGEGPEYVRVGKAIRYSVEALDRFMAARTEGGW